MSVLHTSFSTSFDFESHLKKKVNDNCRQLTTPIPIKIMNCITSTLHLLCDVIMTAHKVLEMMPLCKHGLAHKLNQCISIGSSRD